MKIFLNKNKLVKIIQKEKNVGFVPTMGAIHKGHISLIKKSISDCDKTIVSIYVNKPQFNKKSDYLKYPRNLKKDISLLKKNKVDYLYIPSTSQIYSKEQYQKIKINSFGKKLCGRFRPRHFEAIADVIDRFINIIKPKKIYFGEKDMQQLKIMEDFSRRNHPKIKIVGCKTIREKNGVAYSSRNFLLSFEEIKIASKIYRFLVNKKQKLINNKISKEIIKRKIIKFGAKKIDYIEILNINELIKPYKKYKKFRIFIAYYLRSTRLIDNI